MDRIDWLAEFIGQEVVAEIGEGFTVFGTLQSVSPEHLCFTGADLHNQMEANSSREIYAMETRDLGIRVNRERLCVPRFRLLAISRLEDVRT